MKDFSGVRSALGRSLAAWVCSRVAKARNVNAGFTLIELMVVLSVIVILASMGLAQYRNSVVYASEAVLRQDLTLMRDAIDQYYADKGQYPGGLDSLVSDGYLRKIPDDPFTKSTSSWQTGTVRTGPQQSDCGTRCIRRQERIGSNGTRRIEVRGVVIATSRPT